MAGYEDGAFSWANQSGLTAVIVIFLLVLGVFVALAALIYVNHRIFLHRLDKHEHEDATLKPAGELKTEMDELPDDQRMGIAFSELSYWAPNGRQLLNGVTGAINPGECIAVMGPSGSGKTTCLDVLAGRRRTGRFSGHIYVNGNDRNTPKASAYFDAHCGYMLQLAEAFAPALTVRENLAYAAMLRLPASLSFEEKMERAEQVAAELNMTELLDVTVGGATGGGLSGGQKRKLMLAVEMLSRPAVLFLDEPTSGLDATSALEVMATLRRFCATGRAVAVTIHQPRAEIFSAFDKLLLLYKGAVAFFGSPLLGAKFLVNMASSLHDSAERFDENANPADIVLDILNHEGTFTRGVSRKKQERGLIGDQPDEGVTVKNIGRFAVALFRLSGVQGCYIEKIAEVAASSKQLVPPTPSLGARAHKAWTQLWALESRALLNTSTKAYYAVHCQFWLLGALVFGTLFFNFRNVRFLFSVVYNLPTFGTALWLTVCITFFCDGLATTYEFDVTTGVVSVGQFLLQSMIHLTFWLTCGIVPYILSAMCMSFEHVDAKPIFYALIMILFDAQAFQSFFLMCAAAARYAGARSATNALILAGSTHALLAFFGGFYIPKGETPPGWVWVMLISPRYYTTSAIMRISLEGYNTVDCPESPYVASLQCQSTSSGDRFVRQFGYEDTSVALHALALLLMYFGFSALTLIFLKLDSAAVRPGDLLAPCLRSCKTVMVATTGDNSDSAEANAFESSAAWLKEAAGVLFSKPEELGDNSPAEDPTGLKEPSLSSARFDTFFSESEEGKAAMYSALAATKPDDIEVYLPDATSKTSRETSRGNWKTLGDEKAAIATRAQLERTQITDFAAAMKIVVKQGAGEQRGPADSRSAGEQPVSRV